MAHWKLGNFGNLGNLGNIIPSFLISKFSILPKAKIENSDLKISEKNFLVFRDFRFFRVFYLAYKNSLSEQFFCKWMHFQISLSFSELQVIRVCLCVRDIVETSWNKLLLFILKISHGSYSVEKGVLKNFPGKQSCGPQGLQRRCFPQKFVIHWKNLFLKTTVSSCKSLLTVYEKETANEA